MPEVTLDFADFRRVARGMGIFAEDQLPFAISRALNDTMKEDVRPEIIGPTWAKAFRVRNKGLARASMRIEFSSKGNLTAGVYDALGKANLKTHATGGARPKPSASLAIPNQARVRLHGRGRTPWARNVPKTVPARALRVIPGKGVFVGEGGRLHAVYWFRASASLRKRFEFYESFARKAAEGTRKRFPPRIQEAIRNSFGR